VLRRLLPAALLAAACVVVPATTASASPVATASAVDVRTATQYVAMTQILQPDGLTAQISLYRGRTNHGAWQYSLGVGLQTECASYPCYPTFGNGWADLPAKQVRFDPTLGIARVDNVPVVLDVTRLSPDAPSVTVQETHVVSVTFTGTGPITPSVDHGTVCGTGDPCLFSGRLYAVRNATVNLTVDGVATTGPGTLEADFGVDVNSRSAS
jgi:hypothetical protein